MSKIEQLLHLLMKLPPNLTDIENELKNNYSADEITLSACQFLESCFCECSDFEAGHNRKPQPEEIHSSYIYDICKLLLNYGLNPNLVLGERFNLTNVMYQLKYIDFENVGAKTLRLLLENGADPYLFFDDESFFEMLDFDVVFDVVELENKALFDNEFQMWLLMIGYGATINKNRCPIEVQEGYSIEQFKIFENYKYDIEFLENGWTMHIIDVRTNAEVAKL